MSFTRPEPAKVLLIEDDPHDATLFLERLRHFAPGEFEVTQARSLAAAMAEAASGSYGLAVIDLTLTDSAGIETCSTFHSSHPAVPFIALTGVADGSLMETVQRSGAKAALLKHDCSGSDLIAAMRTASAHAHGKPSVSDRSAKAAAEARLRNAVIDTADGIVVIDSVGKIALVNSGAEQLLGRPTAELLGTELGVTLEPGSPVRAQVVYERDGMTTAEESDSNVRQFDVTELSITELEFWPFRHHWAGKPVTICALRDVSRQMADERRQRYVTKLDDPLYVSVGLDEIATDLAVRLGSLVRFNRFEVAVWQPEIKRLQVVFQLGVDAEGRERSSVVSRSSVPHGFGSWLSERSSESADPCVYVSVGHLESGVYSQRDESAVARCASALASAIARGRSTPALGRSASVPPASGISRHVSQMPGAA